MKKLLALILLLSTTQAFSQYIEFGTGASFTKFKGKILSNTAGAYLPVDDVQLSFNALISGNIPLKYIRDEVVLGVNPTASLSLFYSSVAIDLPVYATIKLGGGSSEKALSVLGTGLGIGAQTSFMSTYLPDYAPQRYNTFLLMPSVMGEATIVFNEVNLYQLRLEITPVPVKKIKKEFVGDISQINIRLVRAFL